MYSYDIYLNIWKCYNLFYFEYLLIVVLLENYKWNVYFYFNVLECINLYIYIFRFLIIILFLIVCNIYVIIKIIILDGVI